MSNSIYLFKEHQKFQVGKSKLNKKAVGLSYFTEIFIILLLLLSIALLWFGGTALRLVWQYSQTGEETLGELLSCRYTTDSKGWATYIRYQFTVNGEVYSNEDIYPKWKRCEGF